MNQKDVQNFIEVMKAIGEEWTPEDVQEKYGDLTIEEALAARKNGLNPFYEFVENVVMKDVERMKKGQKRG